MRGVAGQCLNRRPRADLSAASRDAFTLDGDKARYVFVQWAADTDNKEGGCEHRFSLFRLEPAPAQIASNNYGCDV